MKIRKRLKEKKTRNTHNLVNECTGSWQQFLARSLGLTCINFRAMLISVLVTFISLGLIDVAHHTGWLIDIALLSFFVTINNQLKKNLQHVTALAKTKEHAARSGKDRERWTIARDVLEKQKHPGIRSKSKLCYVL